MAERSMLRDEFDPLGGRLSINTKFLPMVIKSSATPPSLEYITLARISVCLWMQESVRKDICTWCSFYNPIELRNPLSNCQEKWQDIENKVFKSILNLTLPPNDNEIINEVVANVGEQILNFLYYRIYGNQKLTHIYLDNLHWTSLGTIDLVKTVSLLLESDGLSPLKKYELACSICSEKEIHYYLEKLPEKFINQFSEDKKLRLMLYWTLHIRNDREKFFEMRKREFKFQGSDERYIFEYALEAKNEVAMRRIYGKFPDAGIKCNLVYLTKFALQEKSNLCIPYLMSCMHPIQIKEMCVRLGYLVLKRFASDWRLRCYFQPTAKCVLEFIRNMDFSDALQTILLCWNEKQLDDDECKELLHEFVVLVKSDNEATYISVCKLLLGSLFALEDVEAIQQLLRNGSATVKTQIIYSPYGLKECFNLVKSGKLNLLNTFIQEMLQTEEEIDKFKSSFFESQGFKISCHLIAMSSYLTLNQFLSYFQTEEQIKNFKIKLPYEERGIIISNIIKSTTYIESSQLKGIDEFLCWVFDGCVEKMSDCKADVFHRDFLYNNIQQQLLTQVLDLVTLGELRLVNTYLSWAFYSKEKIRKVKNNFFEKRSFDICCHMITHKQYKMLDQFLVMFCTEGEIGTFKYSLPVGKQGKIIKEITKLGTAADTEELIIEFLNYSFEGNNEVVNYVKEMVIDQGKDIDNDCRDIFLEKVSNLMKAGDWPLVDKYMKWAFSVEEERFVEFEPPPPPPPPPDEAEEKKAAEMKKSLGLERLMERDLDFNRPDRMIDPEYRLFRHNRHERINFADQDRLRAERMFGRLERDPEDNRLFRHERMMGRRGRVMNSLFSRRGLRRHRPTQ